VKRDLREITCYEVKAGFSDGLGNIETGDRWDYIDKSAKYVWGPAN